jgi:cysteine synthase B
VSSTSAIVQCGTGVLERIGNTPLCRIERIAHEISGVEILFKAEWLNPGGSVKDRSAAAMVKQAESAGRLSSGRILLDASSGNNGTSLAMIGAAMGYRVRICVPENVSPERKRLLRAYGADLVFTDAAKGSDGAIEQARAMAADEPRRYYYLDQYANPANWRAHYLGTAAEIWDQTAGIVTDFVAVIGTSGTFTGIARRLRELNPGIRATTLQPDSPKHGLKGMKHMASAIVPPIYDPRLAGNNLEIATAEAYEMVRRLAREEGLMVGITSGAALVGCLRVARMVRPPAVIVTIFPDAGDRYLSEKYWDI